MHEEHYLLSQAEENRLLSYRRAHIFYPRLTFQQQSHQMCTFEDLIRIS